ncbi:hypothetical protein ACFV2Z_39830 [Streptomyces sp. NPDC059688]|uniref:hypothetical protein n=1 Tax=Streptomyces sp. NPDC059688 TaxID=3346906 RepID=UPI0036AD8903
MPEIFEDLAFGELSDTRNESESAWRSSGATRDDDIVEFGLVPNHNESLVPNHNEILVPNHNEILL